MSLNKAVSCGLVGNELSKQVTSSNDSSVSRTAVAISSGAAAGALTSGAIVIAAGVASAPVTIPLAVAGGVVAGIASLFD
ncbi:hypothetical protein CWC16_10270 [Pseudoalteromonas sp. S3776]|nr:hypothetical protein CWC16_10270 [Pseudoalteromonas sp. S3776]